METTEERAFHDKIDQVELEELMYDEFYKLIAEAIKIGKANGHEEAMQWIDPNIELPDYYKKVIVKYQRDDSKIDYACVSRLADDEGNYFFGDYHFDIIIDFDRVIGWRPTE